VAIKKVTYKQYAEIIEWQQLGFKKKDIAKRYGITINALRYIQLKAEHLGKRAFKDQSL